MEKLNVGDIVYAKSYNDIYKYVIDRVTATRAMSGTTKFKREFGPWVTIVNGQKYNNTSYYLSTPDLEQAYLRYKVLMRIRAFDFKVLNNDDLITINRIIKKYKDATM